MLLGVDLVVTLDVGLAGEIGPPVGLGVVLAAGLVLAVVQNLSVTVVVAAVAVALALTKRLPVEVVVRDVGPVDGLLSVAVFGSGDGGEGQKNDSNLYRSFNNRELKKKFRK